MYRIELDKAQAQIASLLQTALDGEEVVITRNDQPVLKLVPVIAANNSSRRSGSAKGLISISEDFDAPLEDFAAYTQ
jgi:antitoxin (DNA-binding transcriptional repressor) of toxin-antitoxin stability system